MSSEEASTSGTPHRDDGEEAIQEEAGGDDPQDRSTGEDEDGGEEEEEEEVEEAKTSMCICPDCDRILPTLKGLFGHYGRTHRVSIDRDAIRYACPFCEVVDLDNPWNVFDTVEELESHVGKSHPKCKLLGLLEVWSLAQGPRSAKKSSSSKEPRPRRGSASEAAKPSKQHQSHPLCKCPSCDRILPPSGLFGHFGRVHSGQVGMGEGKKFEWKNVTYACPFCPDADEGELPHIFGTYELIEEHVESSHPDCALIKPNASPSRGGGGSPSRSNDAALPAKRSRRSSRYASMDDDDDEDDEAGPVRKSQRSRRPVANLAHEEQMPYFWRQSTTETAAAPAPAPPLRRKDTDDDEKTLYGCPECDKTNLTKHGLFAHYGMKHGGKIALEMCTVIKPKARKKKVVSTGVARTGPWTDEEHEAFLEGHRLCGNRWKRISAEFVPTRDPKQVGSHALNYFTTRGQWKDTLDGRSGKPQGNGARPRGRSSLVGRVISTSMGVEEDESVSVSSVPEDGSDDGNSSHCIVCFEGGNIVCCSRCPRAYHPKCLAKDGHTAVNIDLLPNDWQCNRCKKDADVGGGEEIAQFQFGNKKIRAAYADFKGCADYNQCCALLSYILDILNKLKNYDYGFVFSEPVDLNDVPDYLNVVKTPMDYGTVCDRLEGGNYVDLIGSDDVSREDEMTTMEEILLHVLCDIERVHHNCHMFNKKGSSIYRIADLHASKWSAYFLRYVEERLPEKVYVDLARFRHKCELALEAERRWQRNQKKRIKAKLQKVEEEVKSAPLSPPITQRKRTASDDLMEEHMDVEEDEEDEDEEVESHHEEEDDEEEIQRKARKAKREAPAHASSALIFKEDQLRALENLFFSSASKLREEIGGDALDMMDSSPAGSLNANEGDERGALDGLDALLAATNEEDPPASQQQPGPFPFNEAYRALPDGEKTVRDKLECCQMVLHPSYKRTKLSNSAISVVSPKEEDIKDFITKSIETGTTADGLTLPSPGFLYICGGPGTGKTTTVMSCEGDMKEWARKNGYDKPIFCRINMAHISAECRGGLMSNMLKKMAKELGVDAESAKLSTYEEQLEKKVLVLILDEIDMLFKTHGNIGEAWFRQLVEWAENKELRFSMIGISNCVNDANATRVREMGHSPRELVFAAYKEENLVAILVDRVGKNIVDPKALQLVSRKVAASGGDAGLALEITSNAVGKCLPAGRSSDYDIALALSDEELDTEVKEDDACMPLVKLSHMMNAIREGMPDPVSSGPAAKSSPPSPTTSSSARPQDPPPAPAKPTNGDEESEAEKVIVLQRASTGVSSQGTKFQRQWYDRLNELKQFKVTHGTAVVSATENDKLYHWRLRQRKRYHLTLFRMPNLKKETRGSDESGPDREWLLSMPEMKGVFALSDSLDGSDEIGLKPFTISEEQARLDEETVAFIRTTHFEQLYCPPEPTASLIERHSSRHTTTHLPLWVEIQRSRYLLQSMGLFSGLTGAQMLVLEEVGICDLSSLRTANNILSSGAGDSALRTLQKSSGAGRIKIKDESSERKSWTGHASDFKKWYGKLSPEKKAKAGELLPKANWPLYSWCWRQCNAASAVLCGTPAITGINMSVKKLSILASSKLFHAFPYDDRNGLVREDEYEGCDAFDSTYQVLEDFSIKYGSTLIPEWFECDQAFRMWVSALESGLAEFVKGEPCVLSVHQIEKLILLGFCNDRDGLPNLSKGDVVWLRHFVELKRHRDLFGTCIVSSDFPRLHQWLSEQKDLFRFSRMGREGVMNLSRFNMLTEAGVDFFTGECLPDPAAQGDFKEFEQATSSPVEVFPAKEDGRTQEMKESTVQCDSYWDDDECREKFERLKETCGHSICLASDDSNLYWWLVEKRGKMLLNELRRDRSGEGSGSDALHSHSILRHIKAQQQDAGAVEIEVDDSMFVWLHYCERLMMFKARKGHCKIPSDYADLPLRQWLARQQELIHFYSANQASELRPVQLKILHAIGLHGSKRDVVHPKLSSRTLKRKHPSRKGIGQRRHRRHHGEASPKKEKKGHNE
ncbi:hypothetical protein ACHAXT_002704 [Thalassiosira profunda]